MNLMDQDKPWKRMSTVLRYHGNQISKIFLVWIIFIYSHSKLDEDKHSGLGETQYSATYTDLITLTNAANQLI